jgi:hypothetical protein
MATRKSITRAQAGCEMPHGVEGGEVGDLERGVRGDRV